MEAPFGRSHGQPKTTTIVLTIIFLTLLLLTIIPVFYPSLGYPFFLLKALSPKSLPTTTFEPELQSPIKITAGEDCDVFSGKWVTNHNAPYYTNTTCWAIHEHQNCMKYGRPDTEFMKWKWKPEGCDLPVLNPVQFLEIVRGKSMAFIGDSVSRNQMQSLICLLSRLEYPKDVSRTKDESFKLWIYTSYNFTMAYFSTPHLVKAEERDANGPTHTGLFNLYLDEFDEVWTSQIEEFDYLIISGGHWFDRPMVFYENHQIVGGHYCLIENVTDLTKFYGFRKAFRTTFRAINSLENFKGVTILRTFAPSHFENGAWNQGGNCVRRKPFESNETTLGGDSLEFYMIQIEEFESAKRDGRKKGKRYRLMDTTQASLLRPDGHPSRYGHWPHENVTLYNDCVHWCLPGPIDTWNDFLLHILKMEGVRSHEERLNSAFPKDPIHFCNHSAHLVVWERATISWTPPPSGFPKFNVDGAPEGHRSHGGILRNDLLYPLIICSKRVGPGSSILTEILAIKVATVLNVGQPRQVVCTTPT